MSGHAGGDTLKDYVGVEWGLVFGETYRVTWVPVALAMEYLQNSIFPGFAFLFLPKLQPFFEDFLEVLGDVSVKTVGGEGEFTNGMYLYNIFAIWILPSYIWHDPWKPESRFYTLLKFRKNWTPKTETWPFIDRLTPSTGWYNFKRLPRMVSGTQLVNSPTRTLDYCYRNGQFFPIVKVSSNPSRIVSACGPRF